MASADIQGMHAGVIYAAKGNIGHPGTSAQRTADNASGLLDIAAKLGAGVTVSAIAVTAAR